MAEKRYDSSRCRQIVWYSTLLASLLVHSKIHAVPFDLIVPTDYLISTNNVGSYSDDWVWIVATTQVIPLAELESLTPSVSIDNAAIDVTPVYSPPMNQEFAPLIPGEVAGRSIGNFVAPFTPFLQSGEALKLIPLPHSTLPLWQVLTEYERSIDTNGTITTVIRIGNDFVRFDTSVTFSPDAQIDHSEVLGVQRLSSQPVPEPSTLVLVVAGVLGLAGFNRRYTRHS